MKSAMPSRRARPEPARVQGLARSARQAAFEAADLVGVPEIGGIVRVLGIGLGAPGGEAGGFTQKGAFVGDDFRVAVVEGRGHYGGVFGEILVKARQQVVEKAVLLGNGFVGALLEHAEGLGRDAFRVEPGVVGHAVDDARAKGAGAVQRVGEALGNPLQIAGVNG